MCFFIRKLDECTEEQKASLEDTQYCINTEANAEATESDLRNAIDTLKQAHPDRGTCKLIGSNIQGDTMVSYCFPPNE